MCHLRQALCSLLRRDASINFKAKGNSLVSVLACNLLMAAYEEDENWPEIFVKVSLPLRGLGELATGAKGQRAIGGGSAGPPENRGAGGAFSQRAACARVSCRLRWPLGRCSRESPGQQGNPDSTCPALPHGPAGK